MKSDIRQELLELQVLQGIDFVRQLKLIVSRKEFRPLDTNPEIFLVGGKDDADYPRLLDAARKAAEHGYRVSEDVRKIESHPKVTFKTEQYR